MTKADIVAVCDAVRAPVNGKLAGISGNITSADSINLGAAVRSYQRLEEFLADPEVELVDLSVPTPLHVPQSIAALQAGKHVLCEKPLAMTPAELEDLAEEFAEAQTPILVAFHRRYDEGYQELRRRILSGELGSIRSVRAIAHDHHHITEDYLGSSGGIWRDLVIHDFDVIPWLLDDEHHVARERVLCVVTETRRAARDGGEATVDGRRIARDQGLDLRRAVEGVARLLDRSVDVGGRDAQGLREVGHLPCALLDVVDEVRDLAHERRDHEPPQPQEDDERQHDEAGEHHRPRGQGAMEDRDVAVAGRPVDNWDAVVRTILDNPADSFEIEIEGKPPVIYGDGRQSRDFTSVTNAVLATLQAGAAEAPLAGEVLNIGSQEEITIRELAEIVRDVVHPSARLVFDTSKPDGPPRKLLDVTRLHALGWRHSIALADGIRETYRWFLENYDVARMQGPAVTA